MRRNTLLVLAVTMFTFVLFTGTALAVPAPPYVSTLSQPDGTTFQAKQWGDEFSHGWQTAEGYTILRDKASGIWYYAACDENGYLVKSAAPADLKAPKGLAGHLRPAKKAAKELAKNTKDRTSKGTASPIGTLKVPILLIDFPDQAHSKTKSKITNVLFGTGATGPGNLQDYYKEVSNNKLTVTPGTGIADWVTADKPKASYGANDTDGYDIDPAALAAEAIQKADASIDFSQYAVNGQVPVVIVVHSGYDESAGEPFAAENDIWAHNWTLSNAGYGAMTVDGVVIDNYTMQSELTSELSDNVGGYTQAIGVFAHELGHALGCPDTYDTSDATEGVGRWDLMASGSWCSTNVWGDTPSHMSAFIKYYLGWVTPRTPAANSNFSLLNIEDNPDEVYMLGSNPGGVDWSFYGHSGTGEYFLLENRSAEKFNAGTNGKGLLIWHVDETASSNNDANAKTPYLLGLEQSDGKNDLENNVNRGDTGDPWPGVGDNSVFDNTSTPSSKYHSGAASGISLSNISVSGDDILLDYGTVYRVMGNWTHSYTWNTTPPSPTSQAIQFTGTLTSGTFTTSQNGSGAYTVNGGSIRFQLGTTGAVYVGTFTDKTHMSGTMSNSGGLTGTWTAVKTSETAEIAVTGLNLAPSSLSLAAAEQEQLMVTVAPEDASNPSVTWSSSNTKVARVNPNGKVTALSAGTAVITCTTVDGGFTAACTVTVTGTASETDEPYIEIVRSDFGDKVAEGDTIYLNFKNKLKYTSTVYDAEGNLIKKPKYKYSSSNKKVCAVAKGKLTAGKIPGTATITITDKTSGAVIHFYVEVAEVFGTPPSEDVTRRAEKK